VLKKEKNTTQDVLARMISTSSSYISAYRKGEKKVGIDLMERLARAYGGRLNMRFLKNESQYMLLENVPDEEILENLNRESNPDYDVIKKRNEEKLRNLDIAKRASEIQMSVIGHIINEPEVINGVASEGEDPRPYLPTWADSLLGILSKQIAENEVLHAELKQSIKEVKEMELRYDEILKKIIKQNEIFLQKKV